MKLKITLIGCGKMGSALLNGWLDNGYSKKNLQVIEKDVNICRLLNKEGIESYSNFEEAPNSSEKEIIIFAVKPQVLEEVLNNIKNYKFEQTFFLSIVAGVKINFYKEILGFQHSYFRAMPNIPVEVKQGMTALFKNENCREEESKIIENLLVSVGDVIWVENEEAIDVVTAISGSGPAYFFYLTECLIKAAISQGLSLDLSKRLSMQTFFGSSELLKSSKQGPETLRKNVTSKGGTTEAALDVLMSKHNLEEIINSAVSAAKSRSQSLSKG